MFERGSAICIGRRREGAASNSASLKRSGAAKRDPILSQIDLVWIWVQGVPRGRPASGVDGAAVRVGEDFARRLRKKINTPTTMTTAAIKPPSTP